MCIADGVLNGFTIGIVSQPDSPIKAHRKKGRKPFKGDPHGHQIKAVVPNTTGTFAKCMQAVPACYMLVPAISSCSRPYAVAPQTCPSCTPAMLCAAIIDNKDTMHLHDIILTSRDIATCH